jgi:anti-sigma regulatory factor (Ser/Thr protein kinase)
MTSDVTKSLSKVHLVLHSRPESVTLARSMVAGFAEGAGLDEPLLNALRTAISEASNNVIVHAYGDTPGPLSVSIASVPEGIDVLVEDCGGGIKKVVPSADRMGLGLAVISSLADRAEFARRPGGGTEVRLLFHDGNCTPPRDLRPTHDQHLDAPVALSGDVVVAVAPVSLLAHILGRLSRAIAAQSHFRVSRISELRAITDAIAVYADHHAEPGPIWFSLNASSRRLELSIGPFDHVGTAPAAEPGDARLAELVDDLTVHDSGEHEFLRVVVLDHEGSSQ